MVGSVEGARAHADPLVDLMGVTRRCAVPEQERPLEASRSEGSVLAVDGRPREVDPVAHLPLQRAVRCRDRRYGRRVVGGDGDARGAGRALAVGDSQTDIRHACGRVGEGRGDGGGVAVGAVAVEVPRVRHRVAVGIGRTRCGERDGQRERARRRCRGRVRHRGRVTRGIGDAVDRAAEQVDVEQVAAGTGLERGGTGDAGCEGPGLSRIGQAAGAVGQVPDATAGVVGKEEGALVLRRVRGPGVEGYAGHRGALRIGAAVAGRHRGLVLVLIVGRGVRRVCVERLARVEVHVVEARVLEGALVTGPTKVGRGRRGRRDPVDLLVVAGANVADPGLVRPRPEVEAERVPHPVGDDAPPVGVGAGVHRVARQALAGVGVDPNQRAAQHGGLSGWTARRLGPQCSALGSR